jgi:hypothetical protein
MEASLKQVQLQLRVQPSHDPQHSSPSLPQSLLRQPNNLKIHGHQFMAIAVNDPRIARTEIREQHVRLADLHQQPGLGLEGQNVALHEWLFLYWRHWPHVGGDGPSGRPASRGQLVGQLAPASRAAAQVQYSMAWLQNLVLLQDLQQDSLRAPPRPAPRVVPDEQLQQLVVAAGLVEFLPG